MLIIIGISELLHFQLVFKLNKNILQNDVGTYLNYALREFPALIFRNWVHFKQKMLYIIYVIYVKYNYYTYILLKMMQTLSYLRLK